MTRVIENSKIRKFVEYVEEKKNEILDNDTVTENKKLKRDIAAYMKTTEEASAEYKELFTQINDALSIYNKDNNDEEELKVIISKYFVNNKIDTKDHKYMDYVINLLYYHKFNELYTELQKNLKNLKSIMGSFISFATKNDYNILILQIEKTFELGIFIMFLKEYLVKNITTNIFNTNTSRILINIIKKEQSNLDKILIDFHSSCEKAIQKVNEHSSHKGKIPLTVEYYYKKFVLNPNVPIKVDKNLVIVTGEEMLRIDKSTTYSKNLRITLDTLVKQPVFTFFTNKPTVDLNPDFLLYVINIGIKAHRLNIVNIVNKAIADAKAMAPGFAKADMDETKKLSLTRVNVKNVSNFEIRKTIVITYLEKYIDIDSSPPTINDKIAAIKNATDIDVIIATYKEIVDLKPIVIIYDDINSLLLPTRLKYIADMVVIIINIMIELDNKIKEHYNSIFNFDSSVNTTSDIVNANAKHFNMLDTAITKIVNSYSADSGDITAFVGILERKRSEEKTAAGALAKAANSIVGSMGGDKEKAEAEAEYETKYPSLTNNNNIIPISDFAKFVALSKYSEMNIDVSDIVESITEDTIETQIQQIIQENESINSFVSFIKDDIFEILPIYYNIVKMNYFKFMKSKNTLSGKKTDVEQYTKLKKSLKGLFNEVSTFLKEKPEWKEQYESIIAMITNSETTEVSRILVNMLVDWNRKFDKMLTFKVKIDPFADTNFTKKQIKKLNKIIAGDDPDDDDDDDDDDKDEDKDKDTDDDTVDDAKKSTTDAKKTKKDVKTTQMTQYNEAIAKILKKYSSVNKDNIPKILKELYDLDMPTDEPIFQSIEDDECLNLDGGKCMELLQQCLRGEKECIEAFNKLDTSKPIDISTMSIQKAKLIAGKIGFLYKDFKDWYKDYLDKNKPLTDPVLKILKAIKRRIDSFDGKPVSCDKEILRTPQHPGMVLRHIASNTGNMTGGGNKNNYNNFIINLNALKNNLSMSGGACNSYSLFLDNLNYLKELLKNNGKELDKRSENAIREVIDKIYRNEKVYKKINQIVTGFIHILEKTNFKFDPKDDTNPTFTILSDLIKKQEKIQTNNSKKGIQLINLFTGVPLPYLMPVITP